MSDKPWEQQPASPSRIITPTDTITVTIDNRQAAPRVEMRCSRVMPRAFVIGVFSSLINQLSGEMMQELMRGIPGALPQTGPGTEPGTERGANGNKT